MRSSTVILLLLPIFKHVSCLASQPVIVSTKAGSKFQRIFSFAAPSNNSTTGASHRHTTSTTTRSFSLTALQQRTQYWLRSTFLPINYPHSVRPYYISYSLWSALQDWSTSLRTVLATQRVLEGVGVGQSTATALSAVNNFLVRDAAGMAATLLFTGATRFTADVKRWRLFADIIVDIGITVEVAAIHVPRHYFVAMLCVANVCKALCGVAAGATGGALTLYWGKDITDLSAKAGAQRTVVAALGLVLSAVFARTVATARLGVVWGLYAMLTVFHIFANVKCLRVLALDSLNTVRLEQVAEHFLDGWSQGTPVRQVLTPAQVTHREKLLFHPWDRRISFGVSFNDFIQLSYKKPSDVLRERLLEQDYLISATPAGNVVVALRRDHATPVDHSKAYFHALLLRRTMRQVQQNRGKAFSQADLFLSEQIAQQEMVTAWASFAEACREAGWDLERSELTNRGFEVDVKYSA